MTYLLNILHREYAQSSFVYKAGKFKDSHLGDGFELRAELVTFFQKSFLHERTTGTCLFHSGHLTGTCSKRNEAAGSALCCHFTGNPLVKFKLSSENENF